jgi:hypothetical protein
VAIYEQTRLGRTATVLPCVLLAAIGITLLPGAVGAGRTNNYSGGDALEIRSERESLYGWVRVIDQKKADLRSLHVGCLDDRRRQPIEWREPAHLPGHSATDPGAGARHETRFCSSARAQAIWPQRCVTAT